MLSIFSRLGTLDKLYSAQRVCKRWYKICKDKSLWKSIDMRIPRSINFKPIQLVRFCHRAVDLSDGDLVDFNVEYISSDQLLMYVADRAPKMKRLRVVFGHHRVTNDGLTQVVYKLPLLEDLELAYVGITGEGLAVVGESCPHLRSLKCNFEGLEYPHIKELDAEALAVAKTMPELRHLQLFGSKLTDKGLEAILDGCPHLESLDLRRCFNINLSRMTTTLRKLQAEHIKDLKLPRDSTAGYEFAGSNLSKCFDYDVELMCRNH